jgi:hypothetical protein
VHRILMRHGMNRLQANQKHQPHGKRWQRCPTKNYGRGRTTTIAIARTGSA